MKIGIADYGMQVWYGGTYDYEDMMETVRRMGYDGIERLRAGDADEVMRKLSILAKLRMDFLTVETGNIERNILRINTLSALSQFILKTGRLPIRSRRFGTNAASLLGLGVETPSLITKVS